VNSAAEHVDHVVQPRDADVNQAPLVESGQGQRTEPEHALRREVVDRQRGRNLGGRALGVDAIDQVGHQGRIPVVDVNHVWRELQRRQHLQQRPREVDRARIIVTESVHAVAVV
jgi:hypothetical protein